MEGKRNYYIHLINEIISDINSSPIDLIIRRYNRVAGIIKRRVDLQNDLTILRKLCDLRDRIFRMRYLRSISIKKGFVLMVFIVILGSISLFYSQFPGLSKIVFQLPDFLHFIIDKVFFTTFSIYIILGGSFNLFKYPIGLICSIRFNGVYIRDWGQLALKKECLSYFRAGKKRILFYLFSSLIPFFVILLISLWLYFVAHNITGFGVLFFHLILTAIFYRKKKGELYRFIRELRISKQQKYLSSILSIDAYK